MPFNERDFFGGYYLCDDPELLWGAKFYHRYLCGKVNGKYLVYICMSKQDLADTQGQVQEAFDLFPLVADELLEHKFFQNGDTSRYLPSVQALITADQAAGLDSFAIMERRAAVMMPEFCGFTFAEVLSNFPDYLVSKKITHENGSVITRNTIWPCSQED